MAWLTYDYAARQVWLDDLPADGGDRWALCHVHAVRLRAPQGWEQVDRRVGRSSAAAKRRGAGKEHGAAEGSTGSALVS